MKISLVVKDGVHAGKTIPIGLSQFLVGRDPQCNLRPASTAISKRHCALLVRQDKVFIRDMNSTNGTFVNERAGQGRDRIAQRRRAPHRPAEFRGGDRGGRNRGPRGKDRAGRRPETPGRGDRRRRRGGHAPGDEGGGRHRHRAVNEESIPTGSTIMEILPVNPAEGDPAKKDTEKEAPKPAATTTAAAEAILQKYLRRPRT